jgi:hypothetical protein
MDMHIIRPIDDIYPGWSTTGKIICAPEEEEISQRDRGLQEACAAGIWCAPISVCYY